MCFGVYLFVTSAVGLVFADLRDPRRRRGVSAHRHMLIVAVLFQLAVALALTLAPVAEARVQVRPVEQTVVLDLFSPSDFNDLGVQRDFCRAFTASIDLDERVGRVVTQKFPTLPVHLLASSAPSLEAPRADTTRRFPLWRRISWTSRAIHEDHHALHTKLKY